MRVIVCPGGDDGCSHYRILQPVEALRKTESTVEVEITNHLPLHQGSDGRITGVGEIDCDVLVIQRPMLWWIPQAIPLFQHDGIAVVVELDDDFHSLHPMNGAYHKCHPKTNPEANWHHLREACKKADLVTVSTPALAERYGGHGRVRVLENYISESWLDIPHAGDGRTVGWAGVVGSHPNDLQVTRGGVAQAVEEAGARFRVVGNGELVEVLLGFSEPVEVTGWQPIDNYPHELAKLDVGLVPLADTRFNAAKSWLKGLEYAACGVPFVSSPVAEYKRLGGAIPRFARDKSSHWRRGIRACLTEEARQDAMSARLYVREHYTIEGNAWKWAEAWGDA